MTVQKTKVFIVDASKGTVKEVATDKAPKYARQFRVKSDALSYLFVVQLEQFMDFYNNTNVNKQLDKVQQIINDIRSQI